MDCFIPPTGRLQLYSAATGPAVYFPWEFKCNFMCELVVARLKKKKMIFLHYVECVNGSKLMTHKSPTHRPTRHTSDREYGVCMHVCSSVMYYSKSVAVVIHLLFRGRKKSWNWHPKIQTAPEEEKKTTNSQTILIPSTDSVVICQYYLLHMTDRQTTPHQSAVQKQTSRCLAYPKALIRLYTPAHVPIIQTLCRNTQCLQHPAQHPTWRR